MARIFPFRALRPVPESAAAVAAVPYDVVNRDEAAALAANNPLSFLHVSRAEIELPPETDPYADEVYEMAVRHFERLRAQAPLVVEEAPSLYFYRLRMGEHEQMGVAACFSLDEYESDRIKKHERTRRDKEDDRTRHMIALRAQTGPVFLTYHANPEIGVIARRTAVTPPLFDFEADDRVRHTLWRVSVDDCDALVAAFESVPALYIADGHHRAASAARARQELVGGASSAADVEASHRRDAVPLDCTDSAKGYGEFDTMLAVAFPDDQVQILAYNRVVKDLAGMSTDAFVHAVEERFPVTDGSPSPYRKGSASMYVGGRWYSVDVQGGSPNARELDVTLLQEGIIAPLLKVGDVRTDKRIDFVGGARGTAALERLVDSGAAAVAFSMYPVTVADLIGVADAGGIMPPKSTWFEPKMRDGLLSHLI